MIRHIMFAVLGVVLVALAFFALFVFGGSVSLETVLSLGVMAIVPLALGVVGIVLLVLAVRGFMRESRRRAMPVATVRAEPAPAHGGHWGLADVASGVARRLTAGPGPVHHAGEWIEIRWGQQRCELRDAGDGLLEHADVAETPLDVWRLRHGVVLHAGQSRMRATSGPGPAAFETQERAAVHTAIDETLALAGWRREG